MTLDEFLLARIEQDEAVARDVIAERAGIKKLPGQEPEVPDMGVWADVDGWTMHVAVGAERVLAECAAKRRIVHSHSGGEHGCPDDDGHSWAENWRRPCSTLRVLAVVHADHPDYDEAWRP